MVRLLISSVNQNPEKLIKKMNISTDAIIVNQCDRDDFEIINTGKSKINIYHKNERGVGKSRNLCIEKSIEIGSKEDICLFSDEDIVYDDNYEEIIENAFKNHPEAKMLLFNVRVTQQRRTYWNEGYKKINRFNCGRYPAYSIAVRQDVLKNRKLKFSELFGGGAKYSNGEDSLFLINSIKKNVEIYAIDSVIGSEEYRESTWFKGYTEKFFYDRGVLFAFLYGNAAYIWALRFILVKKEMFKGDIKRKQALRLLLKGIRRGKIESEKEKM